MSVSREYYDLCTQIGAQKDKVFKLECEVYRMAREKRWEGARSDEGKRIAKREFVEAQLEYTEEKETLDALQAVLDVSNRRGFPGLPSKQAARRS